MEKFLINFKEVGYRAQSKAEIYRTLVTEGKLFLPPIKEASMLFISQLAVGEKKVLLRLYISHFNLLLKALKSQNVKVCVLLHVKGLRSKDLVEFVTTYCNGESYLPDDYVDHTPNRSWLANLCKYDSFNCFDR